MSNVAAPNNTDRIRVLNDNFRSTFVGGQVVMTAGRRCPADRHQSPRALGGSVLQQFHEGQ